MAYKIYTTYLSKMKHAPVNSMKVIIMRFPPFIEEKDDIIHMPSLSPTNTLFQRYKKSNDWEDFEECFKDQMYNESEIIDTLNLLMSHLDDPDGNDVCLVCCEKDNAVCHRRLIAEYLESLGYEWEEL